MVRVKFVNAGQLSARQREQIKKWLREEGANAEDKQEAGDFSDWADEAAERVRAAYQDDGYFKVQVAAEFAPAPKSDADRRRAIVVTVLNAGQQYRLRDLRWKNMTEFSEQQLLDLMPIHPGDIFSRSKVAKGLEEARKLYQSHGYMNFTSIPNTVCDEAARSISLEIDVDEEWCFIGAICTSRE
jgi:outer membrane protein assembly factor BamA